ERSLASFKLAVGDGPEPESVKRRIYEVRKDRVLALSAIGQSLPAVSDQQAAVAYLEARAKLAPNDALRALELAAAHEQLSDLYRQSKTPAEPEVAFLTAIIALEKFPQDNTRAADVLNAQADCHLQAGRMFTENNRPKEAEQHFRKAIEIREKLVQINPNSNQFLVAMGGDHCNLGLALMLKKEFATAIELF